MRECGRISAYDFVNISFSAAGSDTDEERGVNCKCIGTIVAGENNYRRVLRRDRRRDARVVPVQSGGTDKSAPISIGDFTDDKCIRLIGSYGHYFPVGGVTG